ncbi:hypothetical protein [Acinetobacter courvalinii]|uniref:hypothetical protein n=1 Tax=Acinetobacter courvalinii TaxID=280147 RepID=UPI0021CFFA15|nr:hypothetical protein [Acinetobacter courvalinii]MCU4367020.1 hypothetical protein [Acinetobacter courvalinii]MCU4445225.1 hypothetical protein [Acinetobacter courvalinii]
MFIAKNIFVFLLSMLALCLVIIFFNYLGFNETVNLILSSSLFGMFITWYFKGMELCLALFSFFYCAMLIISQSMEVILMFGTSISVYLFMSKLLPKLKNLNFKLGSKQLDSDSLRTD